MSFLTLIEGLFGIKTNTTTTAAQTTAENLYNQLLDEEKKAAVWVSGSLAIVNQNLTIDANLVAPIISSVFPNVNVTDITNTFIGLVKTFETDQSKIPTTLVGAIQALQAYLLPKQGNVWITAIQGLLGLGVTIISPVTPIQKIAAVGEYVYQDIITPLLGLHKSSPIVAPILPVVPVPVAPTPNVPTV